MFSKSTFFLISMTLGLSFGCAQNSEPANSDVPTAEEASQFLDSVETELRRLYTDAETKYWAYTTNITDENEEAASKAEEAVMAYMSQAIPEAHKMEAAPNLSDDAKRQLQLLKRNTSLPAPNDVEKRGELAKISATLTGLYGKGEYCKGDECQDLGDLSEILATSRDPEALLEAWKGWRTISPEMKPMYARFVELGNEGAREIGYADLGDLWRSGYDMSPADFETEVERLWQQVKPLYEALHCHVRAKLQEQYGEEVVSSEGPIPAHLLGNMWSQSWENTFSFIEPYPDEPSLNVTKTLEAQAWGHEKMVRTAEDFFMSLGLDPLPDTFWERSMFVQPPDRDVVCHASAWDVGMKNDLRIKMCIKPNMDDLVTIHHELGHNYYYHAYYMRPVLYQQGAHDGFHEGVGDTLALSITPSYLLKLGLVDEISENDHGILNKQMQDALSKIAFLPFGRMIDQWRWDVFSGKVSPDNYNTHWWQLRESYQGITPPVARTEIDFDPGAKYHIPGNTPYMRYFLAHILQFQFHKALCEASGHEGPIHTCSIYGSKEAGDKLQAMLAMGSSEPWPNALEAITGSRTMDAGPLVEYFQPLMAYLEENNEGRVCGW